MVWMDSKLYFYVFYIHVFNSVFIHGDKSKEYTQEVIPLKRQVACQP